MRQHHHGQRLRQVGASDGAGLNVGVGDEQVFNRRGRHVLALAGFEDVFDAPGDGELALRVAAAFVAGAQPAVGGHGLCGLVWAFEVTLHQRRAAHLYFATLWVNTAFHALIRQAHRAHARVAGQGGMRDAAVFGHAIDLNQIQTQPPKKGQHIGRHGRGAPGGELALVQAQPCEDLAPHQAAQQGNRQQQLEPALGHLLKHALAELDPQARHREKDGGARPLQIGQKRVQALGKKHMAAKTQ